MVQRLKQALIATVIILAVLGAIYLVSFTTCPTREGHKLTKGEARAISGVERVHSN